MRTLVAYDCSGSTGSHHAYHQTTQKIMSTLNESNTRVVLWDTSLEEASFARLRAINDKQEGFGGTCPYLVATALRGEQGKEPCRLIVISDGCVSNADVDHAQKEMDAVSPEQIAQVEVHLIGNSVNMSVSCAFTRHAPSRTFVYTQEGVLEPESSIEVSREDLDVLEKLDSLLTAGEIEAKLPAIERAITVKVMGTMGDRILADALVEMRKRVVADRSRELAKTSPVGELTERVRRGDVELALESVRRITSDYFAPEFAELGLEGRISRLVSACEGSMRTVFTTQGVRGTKLSRASVQEDVQVEGLEISAASTNNLFDCPLTLDSETDVVLLFAQSEDGEDILSGVDVGIVDQCIQCPLAALRFPQVLDRLLLRIDHAVSLQSVQESIRVHHEPFMTTSPFTRLPVLGGLCLGASQQQAKATDWTLARALTKQAKVLGNPDLWFAVVYLAMEANWDAKFSRLGPIVREQLKAHMLFRLRARTSFASLLGLSHVVTTRMPLDVCVWFTLASCAASANEGEIAASGDPLRAHIYHYEQLVKLCELAELKLPCGVVQHCIRLKILLNMLSWTKRADGEEARFRELVRSLHQNALEIDFSKVEEPVAKRERLVPAQYLFVDGEPQARVVDRTLRALPKFYTAPSVNAAQLVFMASKVHPSKSAADVALPYSLPNSVALPAAVREWTTDRKVVDFSVPICPATLRPWGKCPGSGLTWQEAAVKRFGKADLLSTYKWYEDFVFKYGQFPTNAESFVTYMYNRLCVCVDTHTTLPESALEQATQTLANYSAAGCGTSISVDTYKAIVKTSRPLDKRREMEEDYLRG